MNIFRKTSALPVSLIAVLGHFSTSPAQAATPSTDARSVIVSYGHLDLGSAGTIETVYRQFTAAAERACGSYEARNLRERGDWRECRAAAVTDAMARFLSARIASLHSDEASASRVAGVDPAARL